MNVVCRFVTFRDIKPGVDNVYVTCVYVISVDNVTYTKLIG